MRLLDPRFNYTHSTATNVTATWERFGYRPTTDDEREAAQRRLHAPQRPSADVTLMEPGKRKATPAALRLTVKKG